MTVEAQFRDIGARARVRPAPRTPRVGRRTLATRVWPRLPRLDIRRDEKGEYFDLLVPDGVEMEVIDSNKDARHLLLLARLDGKRLADKARYLCGHDERHWFVAAIPESYPASTVEEAKVALQPASLRASTALLPARKRTARHNEVYRRQGEWFFVPEPDFEPSPKDIILTNEPLTRDRRSKPHVVAEAVRSGGETRYQADRASVHAWKNRERAKEIREALDSKTLTAVEKARMEALYPEVLWRSVLVNPTLYVRGTVRHSDHATITLRGWHRVLMNTENLSAAMSHVAFID